MSGITSSITLIWVPNLPFLPRQMCYTPSFMWLTAAWQRFLLLESILLLLPSFSMRFNGRWHPKRLIIGTFSFHPPVTVFCNIWLNGHPSCVCVCVCLVPPSVPSFRVWRGRPPQRLRLQGLYPQAQGEERLEKAKADQQVSSAQMQEMMHVSQCSQFTWPTFTACQHCGEVMYECGI